MLRFDPARAVGAPQPRGGFVLYLEGARDRGILQAWCRRLHPGLAGQLARCSVILGGRRPARALEHFRALGGAPAGARGLCVLDRDDAPATDLPAPPEPGLEFFTWRRRHIESYLLVPGAIRRGLRLPEADSRVERILRTCLPPGESEQAYRELDAKRLLSPAGPVSRALGTSIPLARVARETRPTELHPDVHEFFDRVREELGSSEAQVVR
jgi:hypothetical protein